MDSEPVSDEMLCRLDEMAHASDAVLVDSSILARLIYDLYTERVRVEDLEAESIPPHIEGLFREPHTLEPPSIPIRPRSFSKLVSKGKR